MPELPEVETIRRGLNRLIIGKKIVQVDNDNPKSFPNSSTEVDQFLLGSMVTAVRRRAKVLMIDLSSDHTLVIHLKMTGQLVFVNENLKYGIWNMEKGKAPIASAPEENHSLPQARALRASFRGRSEDDEFISASSGGENPSLRFAGGHPTDSLVGKLPDKSTRVTLTFADGSRLFFNDQRKFGWVKLFPSVEVPNIDFMKRVGPEPLEDDITPQIFIARIRRRNGTTIKAAILDQSVIAGVGNIYADESLWASHIHPARRVLEVTDDELSRLLTEIQAVLRLSIAKGGSTDRNYIDAEGKRGSYLEFANVFRREGQPCNRCGTIIEKIRVAGRGTHICPTCQPLTTM